MFLVRFLKALFRIQVRPKSGYSIRGFWGEIKHFNKNNIQIGYTIKGFWGQRKRYDMNGNLKSVSWKNFWGGYNTYDADGNLIKRSYKNFWGGYNTYDKHGKKIQESYRNFWEGMNHFDIENFDSDETFVVEKRKTEKRSNDIRNTVSSPKTSASKYGSSTVAKTTSKPVTHKKTTESKPVKYETSERRKITINHMSQIECDEQKETDLARSTNQLSHEPVEERNLNKNTEYYSSINEYIQDREKIEYIRLLVFKYEQYLEFPAIAYVDKDMVKVEQLEIGAEPFKFSLSEISKARMEMVSDLEMNVVDDEFLACTISGVGKEFEDLLPEYLYEGGGVCRMQYVFDCGMIITENSMKELQKLNADL